MAKIKKNETVRLCKDQDCPKCGFPETVLVCVGPELTPKQFECSSRDCNWMKKINRNI